MRIVTDADRAIGRRIQAARKLRGLSLAELAQVVLVSHQQMQKYESGLNRVSAAKLGAIASALQVNLGDLFGTNLMPDPAASPSSRAQALATMFDRIADEAMKDAIFRLVTAAIGDGPAR